MSNKYAIGMIIFQNPLYVVGACLSACVHKKFIQKLNLNIKLIVMVDKHIIKYKDELLKYFDYVELIDLIEIKLNPEYKVIYKYSKWMKYSISKWQIFNYEQFDKILFIDTDILPIKKSFYNIFNFDTPAIMIRGVNLEPNILAKKEIFNLQNENINENEYYNLSLKLTKSLDAGIVLIKPDKKLFKDYIKFIKICEGSNGYISKYDSGVDETTLLFFLLLYKNIPIHLIPYDYAPTPWDKLPYNKDNIKGINFLSMIKPWVKLPMIQWADENIWHRIAKKALKHNSVITDLYIKYLIDELYSFVKNLQMNISKSNSPYNTECIKSSKIKSKTVELINYIRTHPKDKLNIKQIELIINAATKIHSLMDKNLFIQINKLKKIIK